MAMLNNKMVNGKHVMNSPWGQLASLLQPLWLGLASGGHCDLPEILQSYLHVHKSSVFKKWAPSRFSSGKTWIWINIWNNPGNYVSESWHDPDLSYLSCALDTQFVSPTGSPLFIENMGATIAPNPIQNCRIMLNLKSHSIITKSQCHRNYINPMKLLCIHMS